MLPSPTPHLHLLQQRRRAGSVALAAHVLDEGLIQRSVGKQPLRLTLQGQRSLRDSWVCTALRISRA